jgi:hypothetical protein
MAKKTRLSNSDTEALRARFPELPPDYLSYLSEVGWGEADSGRMIYSGPVAAASVFGARFEDSSIVLLGDDTMGYCLGFDRQSHCLGELSQMEGWQPWPVTRSFSSYASEP